jgi:uncharacterized protein (TIGR02996 family)
VNLTDSPEEAALLAAVNTSPNDDLPRLIYADWLEEAGFAPRAEEIRLQIALAEAKPWDAISIQHLRYDLGSYRRGFPYRMTVYDIPTLIRTLRSNTVPIGAIDVGTCPLNHWEDLVAMPEFQRIEEVRFTGLTLPIEPLRVLREAANACNIHTLVFNRSNSLAFPEMIRELYLYPLGPQLKKLDIRFGQSGNEEDLFEAMTEHGQPIALEEFRYDGPIELRTIRRHEPFRQVLSQLRRIELPTGRISVRGTSRLLSSMLPQAESVNLEQSDWLDIDVWAWSLSRDVQHRYWLSLGQLHSSARKLQALNNSSFASSLHVFISADTVATESIIDFVESHRKSLRWLDASRWFFPYMLCIDQLCRLKSCDALVRLTLHRARLDDTMIAKLNKAFGPRLELLDRPTGGIEV